MSPPVRVRSLGLRLAALGVVAVLVQVAAVSQITVFGTNADLLPLVVASVGLRCGAVAGAIFGFCTGLFVDCALIQTLGESSLVYVLAGYGAGRLTDLRDPDSALVPMAVGAAATAVVSVGYSLLQFLLGDEAPVSVLLLQQIVVTILIGTLLAGPVHAAVRRALGLGRPRDPRRRGRTSTGLSPLTRA